jgi:hypothetical protein
MFDDHLYAPVSFPSVLVWTGSSVLFFHTFYVGGHLWNDLSLFDWASNYWVEWT